MEQNKKSRNQQTDIYSTDFWQKCQSNSVWKIIFARNDAGTIGELYVKTKTKIHWPWPYTTYRILTLSDHRQNIRTKTIKILEGNKKEYMKNFYISITRQHNKKWATSLSRIFCQKIFTNGK